MEPRPPSLSRKCRARVGMTEATADPRGFAGGKSIHLWKRSPQPPLVLQGVAHCSDGGVAQITTQGCHTAFTIVRASTILHLQHVMDRE
jgi:hypothetical protein